MLPATLNVDEMKSAPKSLFNRPVWADCVGEGAYGRVNLLRHAVKRAWAVVGWERDKLKVKRA